MTSFIRTQTPTRYRRRLDVGVGFRLLLLAIFLGPATAYADATQKPIYLKLTIDRSLGVNFRSSIEENLVNMIAAKLADEYPFWSFVPWDQAIDAGVSDPMPYIDLTLKYDTDELNVLFVVRFHVNQLEFFPSDDADPDKWQIIAFGADALSAVNMPQGVDKWRELVTSAITNLKDKSKGRIREKIENHVPLGIANFVVQDDGVFANLESSDQEVRNIVRYHFRVCCVSNTHVAAPTLVFARGILQDDSNASVVRIRTFYDRTCATSCSEKCNPTDDDQSRSIVGFQQCWFWLESRPEIANWLTHEE